MERRLIAILAADVVGYSRLIGADETGTLAGLKAHQTELIEPRITEHQGRIVKLTGDGILVEFPSVVNAVACAAEIQRGMRQRNEAIPRNRWIEFRIGVHLGDVIVQDGDIFGEGVNVAARLEGIAAPGGITVSGSVRDQVGTRLDLTFEDLGERALKNIERAVRVYNVLFSTSSAHPKGTTTAVSPQVAQRRSIAVLPFANMSRDPEQEYFSDGITEDIIIDLSKISGLLVVDRNTVFTYKGKSITAQQVARERDVRFILEGSVRKAGARVRITGQLIEGLTGALLWAERYDRDLADIFAIQDEITQAIVEQLKVKLLPEEKTAIALVPTENIEAYTYYLRGRQFFHEWTKSYLLLARRMFCKAVELDPRYARAYAGIANCDSALHAWHAAEVSLDDILEMSAKALALDPNLAEAHAAQGLVLYQYGRHAEAIAEFERALALDPSLYEANFFYALLLNTQGNLAAAARFFERAAEIRQDDYLSPNNLFGIYRALDRPIDQMRWAQIGLERAERALELHPESSGPAHRGAVALAHLGERDRAKQWAARALAIDPGENIAHYNVACVYSLLGELDQAMDHLEKVIPQLSPELMKWLEKDSDLDAVRFHPRYQKLFGTRGEQQGPGK
ncbi:adenylate/guanylate cyclase domain-containing protein [Microvirga sp. BT689]|uniref:adenylate/guanylate cyclase domain-containing protein n=1 Tax=Microvirga arvi TaxID=2778731 RepID=UPI001950E02F|nr:adenylate/guanylate cyclase domain-containing protein [Microvirga arvi]MBM6583748.1 adenylate/guanylate cyclase domain-containing protein [Microvirga arvi]